MAHACMYYIIVATYEIWMNSILNQYTPAYSGAIISELKDSNLISSYGSPPIHQEKYVQSKIKKTMDTKTSDSY